MYVFVCILPHTFSFMPLTLGRYRRRVVTNSCEQWQHTPSTYRVNCFLGQERQTHALEQRLVGRHVVVLWCTCDPDHVAPPHSVIAPFDEGAVSVSIVLFIVCVRFLMSPATPTAVFAAFMFQMRVASENQKQNKKTH